MKKGDEYHIKEIHGEQSVLARLNEIGIRKGMRMIYFSQAPFGGPLIFRLGAAMFALRQEEFQCLILQKI